MAADASRQESDSDESDEEDEDMALFREAKCRICGTTGNKGIPLVAENKHQRIREWIQKYLNVQINAENGCSDKVCMECMSKIRSWVSFHFSCQQVQREHFPLARPIVLKPPSLANASPTNKTDPQPGISNTPAENETQRVPSPITKLKNPEPVVCSKTDIPKEQETRVATPVQLRVPSPETPSSTLETPVSISPPPQTPASPPARKLKNISDYSSDGESDGDSADKDFKPSKNLALSLKARGRHSTRSRKRSPSPVRETRQSVKRFANIDSDTDTPVYAPETEHSPTTEPTDRKVKRKRKVKLQNLKDLSDVSDDTESDSSFKPDESEYESENESEPETSPMVEGSDEELEPIIMPVKRRVNIDDDDDDLPSVTNSCVAAEVDKQIGTKTISNQANEMSPSLQQTGITPPKTPNCSPATSISDLVTTQSPTAKQTQHIAPQTECVSFETRNNLLLSQDTELAPDGVSQQLDCEDTDETVQVQPPETIYLDPLRCLVEPDSLPDVIESSQPELQNVNTTSDEIICLSNGEDDFEPIITSVESLAPQPPKPRLVINMSKLMSPSKKTLDETEEKAIKQNVKNIAAKLKESTTSVYNQHSSVATTGQSTGNVANLPPPTLPLNHRIMLYQPGCQSPNRAIVRPLQQTANYVNIQPAPAPTAPQTPVCHFVITTTPSGQLHTSQVMEPQQQLPVVARQAPVVAPQASVVARQSPVVAPQASVVARQSPVVAPQASVVARQSPVVAPQASVVARQAPFVAPQASVVARQPPVDAQQVPVVAQQVTTVDFPKLPNYLQTQLRLKFPHLVANGAIERLQFMIRNMQGTAQSPAVLTPQAQVIATTQESNVSQLPLTGQQQVNASHQLNTSQLRGLQVVGPNVKVVDATRTQQQQSVGLPAIGNTQQLKTVEAIQPVPVVGRSETSANKTTQQQTTSPQLTRVPAVAQYVATAKTTQQQKDIVSHQQQQQQPLQAKPQSAIVEKSVPSSIPQQRQQAMTTNVAAVTGTQQHVSESITTLLNEPKSSGKSAAIILKTQDIYAKAIKLRSQPVFHTLKPENRKEIELFIQKYRPNISQQLEPTVINLDDDEPAVVGATTPAIIPQQTTILQQRSTPPLLLQQRDGQQRSTPPLLPQEATSTQRQGTPPTDELRTLLLQQSKTTSQSLTNLQQRVNPQEATTTNEKRLPMKPQQGTALQQRDVQQGSTPPLLPQQATSLQQRSTSPSLLRQATTLQQRDGQQKCTPQLLPGQTATLQQRDVQQRTTPPLLPQQATSLQQRSTPPLSLRQTTTLQQRDGQEKCTPQLLPGQTATLQQRDVQQRSTPPLLAQQATSLQQRSTPPLLLQQATGQLEGRCQSAEHDASTSALQCSSPVEGSSRNSAAPITQRRTSTPTQQKSKPFSLDHDELDLNSLGPEALANFGLTFEPQSPAPVLLTPQLRGISSSQFQENHNIRPQKDPIIGPPQISQIVPGITRTMPPLVNTKLLPRRSSFNAPTAHVSPQRIPEEYPLIQRSISNYMKAQYYHTNNVSTLNPPPQNPRQNPHLASRVLLPPNQVPQMVSNCETQVPQSCPNPALRMSSHSVNPRPLPDPANQSQIPPPSYQSHFPSTICLPQITEPETRATPNHNPILIAQLQREQQPTSDNRPQFDWVHEMKLRQKQCEQQIQSHKVRLQQLVDEQHKRQATQRQNSSVTAVASQPQQQLSIPNVVNSGLSNCDPKNTQQENSGRNLLEKQHVVTSGEKSPLCESQLDNTVLGSAGTGEKSKRNDLEQMNHILNISKPINNDSGTKVVDLGTEASGTNPTELDLVCGANSITKITETSTESEKLFETEPVKINCSICQLSFIDFNQLQVHSETHSTSVNIKNIPIQVSCYYCNKKFHNMTNMEMHISTTHLGLKIYTCQICDKNFSTKAALTSHSKTHDVQNREYFCNICHKNFSSQKIRSKHKLNTHHICDICYKSFLTRRRVLTHKQLVHGGSSINKFNCNVCQFACKNSATLEAHVKRTHPNTFNIDLTEVFQNSALKTIDTESAHDVAKNLMEQMIKSISDSICIENQQLTINQTPQSFTINQVSIIDNSEIDQQVEKIIDPINPTRPTSSDNINKCSTSNQVNDNLIDKQPENIDTQPMPIIENQCANKYSTKSTECQSIQNQSFSAESKTKNRCRYCKGKYFKTYDKLLKHIENTHKNILHCKYCKFLTENEDSMTMHTITHEQQIKKQDFDRKLNERLKSSPFPCMYCVCNFDNEADRDTHGQVHHAKSYPYPCSDCPMRLESETFYVTHVKLHEPLAKYSCKVCHKKFTKNRKFKDHVKLHKST